MPSKNGSAAVRDARLASAALACLCLAWLSLAACREATEPSVRPSTPSVASSAPAQLDLSADASRFSEVDRVADEYLGHPSTVLLGDGTSILVAYPRGHGAGPIVLKRSDDRGRSWSARMQTPTSFQTSKETPTLFRVRRPEGGHRLLLFSGRRREYPNEKVRMAHSEDEGRTWSELSEIGAFGGVVAMASIVDSGAGLLAFFHDDAALFHHRDPADPPRSVILSTRSFDGGLTWSAPRIVIEHPDVYLCEPCAIRAPHGKQLALVMRDRARTQGSYVMFSDDEGVTFGPPKLLARALSGDRHVAKYLPDGRLFVSMRDTDKDSPTRGDWVAWVGQYDDLKSGRPGQLRVRLFDNKKGTDCGYSGVELLQDGEIVATSYGHIRHREPASVFSIHLHTRELKAPR